MNTRALIYTGIFVGCCRLLANVSHSAELSAVRSNGTIIVSWPTQNAGHFFLQQSPELPGDWTTVTNSFATNRILFPVDTAARFYRLASVTIADPRITKVGLIAEYLLNGNSIDSVAAEGLERNGSIRGGVSFTTNRFGTPDSAVWFNGVDGFIQIEDDDLFSISTTGELSISAWMRPDTDTFLKADGTAPGHWVYWLSKIEYGNHCDPDTGSQDEFAFRMYNKDSGETEPAAGVCGSSAGRPNWVSAYVFNLCAAGSNFGAGSRTQCSPALIGVWTHYVAVFQHTGVPPTYGRIQLFKNGQRIDSDPFVYNNTVVISPANGKAPVRFGKGSGEYYFRGAVDNVRFYNRAITDQEVMDLFHDQTP